MKKLFKKLYCKHIHTTQRPHDKFSVCFNCGKKFPIKEQQKLSEQVPILYHQDDFKHLH